MRDERQDVTFKELIGSTADEEKKEEVAKSNEVKYTLKRKAIVQSGGEIDLYRMKVVKPNQIILDIVTTLDDDEVDDVFINLNNEEGIVKVTKGLDVLSALDLTITVQDVADDEADTSTLVNGRQYDEGIWFDSLKGYVNKNILTYPDGKQRVLDIEEEKMVFGFSSDADISGKALAAISHEADKSITGAVVNAIAVSAKEVHKAKGGDVGTPKSHFNEDMAKELDKTDPNFEKHGITKQEEIPATAPAVKTEAIAPKETKPSITSKEASIKARIENADRAKAKKEETKERKIVSEADVQKTITKIGKVKKSTTKSIKAFKKKLTQKKVGGVELWLPNSNMAIRFLPIDTSLKKFGMFNKMRVADTITEDLDVLVDIVENSIPLFADAHEFSAVELLGRISDLDVSYLYYGSFMATIGKEATVLRGRCPLDGGLVTTPEINLMSTYEETLTPEAKRMRAAYDTTKTLDELQENLSMGVTYTFAKEEGNLMINITGEIPDALRRIRMSSEIKQFILTECSHILDDIATEEKMSLKTSRDTLAYLQQNFPTEVSMASFKIETLINVNSITVLDKEDGEALELAMSDIDGTGVVTLSDMSEALSEISDGLLQDFGDFMGDKDEPKNTGFMIYGNCNHKRHMEKAATVADLDRSRGNAFSPIDPKEYLFIMLQQVVSTIS